MIDWIGITGFDDLATGEYANISVRRTKAGKPNKTDLRRFVRKRSIPRRFIQHGLRMLNPDEDWPPEYVWEGDPLMSPPTWAPPYGKRCSRVASWTSGKGSSLRGTFA